VLVDVANPLDFSRGIPPTLTVCNTVSLGEQIQRRFSETHVVKALNTVNREVMVDPGSYPGSATCSSAASTPTRRRSAASAVASHHAAVAASR
jgi:predicted dinucleotide-binding enzyme